jgi:hypothetical protein
VIPGRLCNCGSPQTSYAWQKNPIRALKEDCADLNNRAFAGVLLLIPEGNPFAGRKKLFFTSETRLVLSAGEMDEKMAASVTTRHLVPWRPRGNAMHSPPNRLPNPDFQRRHHACNRPNGRDRGGGGVSRRPAGKCHDP